MHTTRTNQTEAGQTELPLQLLQPQKRVAHRIPAYSPIIRHRIQRADWMTEQVGNLLIACGRLLRHRTTSQMRLS